MALWFDFWPFYTWAEKWAPTADLRKVPKSTLGYVYHKDSYTSVYATLNQRLQYALHQRLQGHTAPASTGKSYAGLKHVLH